MLKSVETVFILLITSYILVLFLALAFLKLDKHQSLRETLRTGNNTLYLYGAILAISFHILLIVFGLVIGGTLEVTEWFSLKGYERYAVSSLPLAFILYLAFASIGAFVEEVAYRGYVQSRIANEQGELLGIVFSSVIFSLQHIHVFSVRWISQFLVSQLLYVFLFGLFIGYFFYRTKHSLKGVIAFHVIGNIFNVAFPVQISYSSPIVLPIVVFSIYAILSLILKQYIS
jgi:membrane protease YdiL (CAAX protease family)